MSQVTELDYRDSAEGQRQSWGVRRRTSSGSLAGGSRIGDAAGGGCASTRAAADRTTPGTSDTEEVVDVVGGDRFVMLEPAACVVAKELGVFTVSCKAGRPRLAAT